MFILTSLVCLDSRESGVPRHFARAMAFTLQAGVLALLRIGGAPVLMVNRIAKSVFIGLAAHTVPHMLLVDGFFALKQANPGEDNHHV